jgi:PAS domain S-box-containing protein
MTMVDLQEGRILASKPAMQKMLGYTAKELSRMQFTKFTYPDDVESQWVLHKEMVAGNLKHFEIKKRYIRKDGTVIRARLVANLALRTSGKPAVVIGMIEEIA